MDVVWGRPGATVRQIITDLPNDPAYTTIATVLRHLHDKAMVRSFKDGHSTRYAATRTREQHAAALMQHALATSPDRATSILNFVETMSQHDLELLRDYLAREGPNR